MHAIAFRLRELSRFRYHSTSPSSSLSKNRILKKSELSKLPEFKARGEFLDLLSKEAALEANVSEKATVLEAIPQLISAREMKILIDSSFLTFCLHVDARIASFLQAGYYTIGVM